MITHDNIRETPTYKKLTPIQQKMVVKYKSFKQIQHEVEVVRHQGMEKWETITGISWTRQQIVKEIIENDK